MKKTAIMTGIAAFMLFSGAMLHSNMTVYAAEPAQEQQVKQLSPRWYEQNGVWYLRNEDGTGNVINSWFQDAGDWYLLAQGDGRMYAGLVHDTITDRWYMLNTEHDGTYGRMFCVDGVYTVNGKEVYLTFNQSHDGTFGSITSGLESLKGTGVHSEDVAGIATESAGSSSGNGSSHLNNGQGNSNNDSNSELTHYVTDESGVTLGVVGGGGAGKAPDKALNEAAKYFNTAN